ncbi:ABC transporter permease [Paenibacillus albidus]|uniref:ABC transporter permease n=1 Tax=Paenibacillus albidus TaxID=2041023 RepID=UPI001BEC5342|nr:ABC transporter permease [Paenibacillus albidus]MBT2290259.1 ABC transporter permease [Paenibacillus albidus]
MKLFLTECRQTLKSIIYFVFIGVMILFYFTQLSEFAGADIAEVQHPSGYNSRNPLMKPPPDADNYGSREAEIPEQVMPAALNQLLSEYANNQYTTYPVGFYKNVKLSQEKQEKVAKILQDITGQRPEDLMKEQGKLPLLITYDSFKVKMAELDTLLGGGSKYEESRLEEYGNLPVTYEEKLAEYHNFIQVDKVTGAYARLFCDYMGIVISLFSVFVPVAFLIRDRKAGVKELLYSRKHSSAGFILARYFALVTMLLLPVLLLSLFPLTQLALYGSKHHIAVDLWAFAKYILAWLLPTLMTTTAVAFVLTTLTDTPIAIAVQLFWSYTDLISGSSYIYGGHYGTELAIRHNTLDNLQAMQDGLPDLILNRSVYVLFSLLLVGVTIVLYELKRRGKLDVYGYFHQIFRNRKSPIKADTLG